MDLNNVGLIGEILLTSVGVGIGLFLGKYLIPFLLWLKGGIEDGDGKLENKELQIAWFSMLCLILLLSIGVFNAEYPDSIIYCTYGAATGMYIGRQFTKKGNKDDR